MEFETVPLSDVFGLLSSTRNVTNFCTTNVRRSLNTNFPCIFSYKSSGQKWNVIFYFPKKLRFGLIKEMRGGRRSRVKWRCLATFIFYSFFSYGSCIHLWLVNMQLTGAPNDGFFLNTLKTLLRLSRVLLDLWKCILSGAKKIVSVRSS